MVRRTARRGFNAGRDFWGCSRYPVDECPGKIDIGTAEAQAGGPGAFAQGQFERRRQVHRRRIRATLPIFTALTVLLAVGSYLLLVPQIGWIAGLVAFGACLVGIWTIVRLPPEALYWDRGAKGERKTAEAIEPLLGRGFVVLFGKLMPDDRGDIDTIAIGPTGVWVIETKNLSGSVSILIGKLLVDDRDRQSMVEQVYREAFAVQQIVGELLAPAHTMAAPVLCIHGARTPTFDHSVGGVRVVSGRQLAKLIGEGPQILDPELVQKVADLADRKLRTRGRGRDGDDGDTAGGLARSPARSIDGHAARGHRALCRKQAPEVHGLPAGRSGLPGLPAHTVRSGPSRHRGAGSIPDEGTSVRARFLGTARAAARREAPSLAQLHPRRTPTRPP
jgi:hypothetical protein